jgi:hypothetical protein
VKDSSTQVSLLLLFSCGEFAGISSLILFFSISFDFNRFGWGETKAEVLDMGRVLGVVLIHVHIFESVVDKTHLSPDAAGTHILSPRTSRRKKVKGKIIIMKRPIGKGVPWSR